jgi:hypothetical protein
MDDERSVPITPELFKGLKRRTYRRQRGYSKEEYASVLERVTRTGETLGHVEREFPEVMIGTVAQRLSKLAFELELPVDIAQDDEHGVCVAPNPFKKPPVTGTVETDGPDNDE